MRMGEIRRGDQLDVFLSAELLIGCLTLNIRFAWNDQNCPTVRIRATHNCVCADFCSIAQYDVAE